MVTSLLEIHSKMNGSIPLSSLLSSARSDSELPRENVGIPECLEQVLEEADCFISFCENSTLVYISGYVAFKLTSKMACEQCKFLVSVEKELLCEVSSHVPIEYTQALDRGRLKYPSLHLAYLATIFHCTFNNLISEKYESEFLKLSHKRQIVINLVV